MMRVVTTVVRAGVIATALLGLQSNAIRASEPQRADKTSSSATSTLGDRDDMVGSGQRDQRPGRFGPRGMRPGGMRPGGMGFGRGRPGGMSPGRDEGASVLDMIYALDLTEDQQNRMREIRQEMATKTQEFIREELPTGFGAGRGLVMGEMREKLLLQAYDKAHAMLTPEQKVQLRKLAVSHSATTGPEEIDRGLLDQLARSAPARPQSKGQRTDGEWSHHNAIDTHVQNTLRAHGLVPATICSDEVFIRRVYLDVIGAIPTAREVVDFLQNDRPGKRAELIDALLERSEFADYQAMKWCDVLRVKSEFPINLWPNGAAVYRRWIRNAIRTNGPYDKFVRALLTSSGSNSRTPPVNFYRATRDRDPDALAQAVALTFMGTRIMYWSEVRRRQMAVFFSRIAFKSTQEWKEEIVCWNWEPLDVPDVVFPDGAKVRISADTDPRQLFADWLITPENPWFTKSVVNRVWFWLMGRGIVHEPDDMRADNPASNPALLDYLSKELCRTGYDLKHIYRIILNSYTYQQGSIQNVGSPEADALFAHYPMRRIEAEVLEDALCRIFHVDVGYQSDIPEPFTYIPPRQSTVSLADGSISSPFLKTFGRPSRDRGLESDRQNDVTESHRLFFINSTELNGWIQGCWWLRTLPIVAGNNDPASIRLLWLRILSRYPTPAELRSVAAFYQSKQNRGIEATQDLVWALIATKEFSCRH